MHAVEDGPEHQDVADVPPLLGPEHQLALDLIPWETRAVVDLSATTTGPPDFEFWMRTPAVDPALAPPLAAYATDLTLIGTALRPMDGLGPARQRHAVHLGRHLSHAVVSPAVPHRRMAAAAPAQPAARARPQLRPGRCAHRGRQRWSRRSARRRSCGYAPEAGNCEKRVLLSGEYKSQKWIVPLTPVRRWCQSL